MNEIKEIIVEYDVTYKDYYLIIKFYDNSIIAADCDIIEYFSLPKQYWYDNIFSFNSCYSETYESTYFKHKQDAIKAKQWFIDNLDYFLILKKLGGK